jgi:predicted dehydrogenase
MKKMTEKLRWGMMGPGGITLTIVHDFGLVGISFDAVGSRSADRAKAYAETHSIPKAYGSYEELVADPDLDIIYIATTHNAHFENAKLALSAGKHVLLEKPFTLDASEAKQLVALAKEKDVFLMEAMWTRFLPNHVALFEKINEGIIGNPLYVIADHNQFLPKEKAPRLHDSALGGGSLIDVGIYPISFAHRIFGVPEKIKASATLMPGNIDESVAAIFDYSDGRLAMIQSSIRVYGPIKAFVMGDKGRIELEKPFFEHSSFTVYDMDDKVVFRYEGNIEGRGMQYQALEVERCIRAGLRQSPIMSLDETVEIMEVMDEIRQQTGIEYSGV